MRHGLLLEHSQDRSEEPGLLRLEHVHDVAVGSPVQGEVFDQAVLRRLDLFNYQQTQHEARSDVMTLGACGDCLLVFLHLHSSGVFFFFPSNEVAFSVGGCL